MNNTIQSFARQSILDGLAKCTEAQVHFFKRLYSNQDLTLPLETVVQNISEENLDRVLDQVERTLVKNAKEGK